jgi:hypothetical protein
MTEQEFRQLYRVQADITRRQARIERLEKLQEHCARELEDVVPSSLDAGSESRPRRQHVRKDNPEYLRREDQIRRMKMLNRQQAELYEEGCTLVELCEDWQTRAAASAHCLEGKSYPDIVAELRAMGVQADAEALRKAVDRWVKKAVEIKV